MVVDEFCDGRAFTESVADDFRDEQVTLFRVLEGEVFHGAYVVGDRLFEGDEQACDFCRGAYG